MRSKAEKRMIAGLLIFIALLFLIYLIEGANVDWKSLPEKLRSAPSGEPAPLPASETPSSGAPLEVEVSFIDTGQSESVLIIAPEKTVLIDAGDRDSAAKIGDFLSEREVSRIDLFVATHPHSDHIGSGAYVVETFDVEELLIPDIPQESYPTSSTYEKLLLAAEERDTVLTLASPGTEYELGGGVVLKVLAPCSDYGTDYNNWSVVTKLTAGEISFLFTGDIEAVAEADLMASGADLSCTVLKAPHHGSSSSSSAQFLDAANPRYAVILCGSNNDYGHPHREVREAYAARGYEIYRTDLDGSVIFKTDGESITVETEK